MFQGIAEFAMSMPNNGFMGFPVALIFFGGQRAAVDAGSTNAAMNFFIFTYGVKLLRDMKDGRSSADDAETFYYGGGQAAAES